MRTLISSDPDQHEHYEMNVRYEMNYSQRQPVTLSQYTGALISSNPDQNEYCDLFSAILSASRTLITSDRDQNQ